MTLSDSSSSNISNNSRQTNVKLIAEFKKNLKMGFEHLDDESIDYMTKNLKLGASDASIPPEWQEYIKGCFEQHVLAMPDRRFIRSIVAAWIWMLNPSTAIWEAIMLLDLFGAGSVTRLTDQYNEFLGGLGDKQLFDNERKAFEQRTRKALQHLATCGVIGIRHLDAKDLGSGRFEVDIYYAPEDLRKPGSLEYEIAFYTKKGGRKTTKDDVKAIREEEIEKYPEKEEKRLNKKADIIFEGFHKQMSKNSRKYRAKTKLPAIANKWKSKRVEELIKTDGSTRFACEKCKKPKKVTESTFFAYQETNDIELLTKEFFGRAPNSEADINVKTNYYGPCRCGHNVWRRTTLFHIEDNLVEQLTLVRQYNKRGFLTDAYLTVKLVQIGGFKLLNRK